VQHSDLYYVNTQICIMFPGARISEGLAKDQCQPWGCWIYKDHLRRYIYTFFWSNWLLVFYVLAAKSSRLDNHTRAFCYRLCNCCELQRAGSTAWCRWFPCRWSFFEGNEKSRKTVDALFLFFFVNQPLV